MDFCYFGLGSSLWRKITGTTISLDCVVLEADVTTI